MKTKLLPLVALISMAAMTHAQAASIPGNGTKAYAVDSNGNIVTDSYGDCVRSSAWTPETAIAACETKTADAAASASAAAAPATTSAASPAPELLPPHDGDITGDDKFAYVVDSEGRIVRDNYGYCVRSIDWTKETAINKCEGWEEPKPEPVVAPAPAPKPAPVVEQVQEDAPAAFRGWFDFDKAELRPVAKEKLDVYADYLERHSEKHIKVVGHTCSMGPEEYNQGLSERRANAVKTYLQGKGISGERIETLGMGESQPIATNDTIEGRQQNRRVEVEVIIK
jgi:OOP family OmpA-OmpF porin